MRKKSPCANKGFFYTNLFNAMSATASPIESEDVAAGEGAFKT
jgi:hypothetical protein